MQKNLKIQKNKTTMLPSNRLFVLLGLMSVLALGAFWFDIVALIWMGCLILLMVLVLLDLFLLGQSRIQLEKHEFNHQPTAHRPFMATLTCQSDIRPVIRFKIEAIENDLMVPTQLPAKLEYTPEGKLTAQWELTAKKRGSLQWPGATVHLYSFLRLVEQWQTLPSFEVRVYPKLNSSISEQLNPNMLLDQMGVKSHRFRRADQIFDALRPYINGDNYRHIDWKASARSGGLVTRQFQMEHHHNILVCLDSSRLMGTLTNGISKLDWAIEATLHLAYLSDYFKDKIGLLVFSNSVERWVKPLNRPVDMFLNSVYDLDCKIVESDLNSVCGSILAAQKKRSLVIFLSDFLDSSSLQPFMPSFAHLNRKHCTLYIGIEDPAYKKHLDGFEAETAMDVAERIVAQDSMNRRQVVMSQLQKMGLRAISVTPETLVQRAMNAYLEIKLAGAI